ncbi:hypothetical protein SLE2022_032780 [Rubroshorea leprosula]
MTQQILQPTTPNTANHSDLQFALTGRLPFHYSNPRRKIREKTNYRQYPDSKTKVSRHKQAQSRPNLPLEVKYSCENEQRSYLAAANADTEELPASSYPFLQRRSSSINIQSNQPKMQQ